MSQNMLRKILEKLLAVPADMLGTVYDLLKKMVDEPDEWVEATKRFLRKEDPWPAKAQEIVAGLLKAVTTVALFAVETIKAKDHFKMGEVNGVKIGLLGDSFQQAFLSGKGKIETAVAEATLRIFQLTQASVDTPIIAELGGEKVAETTLSQMWQMLVKQGHGETGDLRVDGYANIFYVRDTTGTLWAVGCRWYSDFRCWDVGARSITDPLEWFAGGRVVSR